MLEFIILHLPAAPSLFGVSLSAFSIPELWKEKEGKDSREQDRILTKN